MHLRLPVWTIDFQTLALSKYMTVFSSVRVHMTTTGNTEQKKRHCPATDPNGVLTSAHESRFIAYEMKMGNLPKQEAYLLGGTVLPFSQMRSMNKSANLEMISSQRFISVRDAHGWK